MTSFSGHRKRSLPSRTRQTEDARDLKRCMLFQSSRETRTKLESDGVVEQAGLETRILVIKKTSMGEMHGYSKALCGERQATPKLKKQE